MVITTPSVSFADRDDNKVNNEYKVRAEQKLEVKNKDGVVKVKGNSEFSNAIFHRFEDWFKNKKEILKNRKAERVEEREDSKKKIVKDNLAPKIENITAPTVLLVDEVGTWEIKASDPKNGSLSYAVLFGDTNTSTKSISSSTSQTFVQTSTFTHSYKNEGTYKIKFIVSNEAGLKAISTVTVKVVEDKEDKDEEEKKDTTAPVISKIKISTDTSNNVNISWKTNEKATGEVFYGTNKEIDVENTNTLRVSDKSLKTDHSFNIPSLASDTIYHFILKSSDASNNATLSSESTFVTN
ncbi:TPA: hypothetical protein DIC38_01510 [Candidatus Nomurabacteria bacterium]|nr:hypothetical protein [Candidatus Nomurabacteria bacterium]